MKYSCGRLWIHSAAHFAADFACFFALFSTVSQNVDSAALLLLYNVLAFGLQPLLGIVADNIDDVRPFTLIGLFLIAWGTLFSGSVWLCVVLIGTGNAIFHVGGAVAVLRHRPSDTGAAGAFVAPGALGIAFGRLAGDSMSISPYSVVFILLIAMVLVWAIGAGAKRGAAQAIPTKAAPVSLGAFAVIACLISIGLRSYIGVCVSASAAAFSLLPAFSAFFGKLVGGFAARRMSWGILGGVCAALSGLVFAFLPSLNWVGVLLLNAAMPITLCAVTSAMPKNIGLGFGLTTLFLLFGTAPAYIGIDSISPIVMLALALVSALLLILTLRNRKQRAAADTTVAPILYVPEAHECLAEASDAVSPESSESPAASVNNECDSASTDNAVTTENDKEETTDASIDA